MKLMPKSNFRCNVTLVQYSMYMYTIGHLVHNSLFSNFAGLSLSVFIIIIQNPLITVVYRSMSSYISVTFQKCGVEGGMANFILWI